MDERERVRFSLAGLPRIIKLLRRLFKMYVEYIPLKKFVLVRRELAVTETVVTVFLSNIKVHINSWLGVSQVTASKLKTGISKEKKVREFEHTATNVSHLTNVLFSLIPLCNDNRKGKDRSTKCNAKICSLKSCLQVNRNCGQDT